MMMYPLPQWSRTPRGRGIYPYPGLARKIWLYGPLIPFVSPLLFSDESSGCPVFQPLNSKPALSAG
eukprot:757394-Hanusia_phi.AAC.3